MAGVPSSSPGRVSPEQQKASDDAAAAKNTRGGPMQINNNTEESARAAARNKRNGYTSPNVNGNSDNVENKTNKADKTPEEKFQVESQQEVVDSGARNVLNGYRSVTYNFTIAALDNHDLKDPTAYRNSELKYVILKSGGKGVGAISGAARGAMIASQARSDFAARDPRRVDLEPEQQNNKFEDLKDYGSDLVNQFNKESPGAFDMFINDVTIDTIMTTNESSNSTLPTKIKFTVFEPYSINGFIEALYVAALAAGYESYLDACFLLKMEFWGYPDNVDLPEPELIKGTERYFPFGLTEVSVDVTESGTRYQCSAVPYNERTFGQSNVIKKPIKMEGGTVGEILENLFKNINAQVKESDDQSKDPKPKEYDTYSVKFPTRDSSGKLTDTPNKNIKDKKLTEILKDNALYAMNRPEDTNKPNGYQADDAKKPSPDKNAKEPSSIKYEPGKTVINFQQNMNINDAISSVLRDSEFVKDMLKAMGNKPNVPDQFGFVDYFIIKVDVTNKDPIDPQTKRHYQNYVYNVVPYKVHYTRIPGYGQTQIKEETFKKLSTRTYNYIYTGQNLDVLNFKLNFNTLFFEAVPTEMGNKDTVSSKSGAGPAGNSAVKTNYSNTSDQPKDRRLTNQVPLSPVKAVPTPVKATTGGNAGQQKDDPYSVLAKHMHESVINSKASMITGEMEILGDPFYIATGGVGNYNPGSSSRGVTSDGEADHNYTSVLITVNFRNPLDVNTFEEGGMAKFDSNRVPFSGVYQVTQVSSTFKDGLFKQKLDIIRMPGQVLDSNLRDRDPADIRITKIDPSDQVVPDNTRSLSPTQRMDSTTVMDQLDRGLPSPGLPGNLSNFTAATGGLGGDTASLLNQTAGQVAGAGSLIPQVSSIAGQPLPKVGDISSNIRLQSAGLVDINQAQKSLGSASLIAVASNVLTGNLPIERAAGIISGSLINSAIGAASKISNIGSGIGKGATVSVNANIPTSINANVLKYGENISPTTLPSGSIAVPISAASIEKTAIDAVTSIGKGANNIVNGIGDKINALTSSPVDPQSIAAKVGLDPAKLSGLGGALQSKLPDQLKKMVGNVPANVNLQQAASAGLVLDYIPASKIANIPATPPYSTAPVAAADIDYAKSVIKRGGMKALENLYGVNNAASISASLVPSDLIAAAKSSVPNVQLNPFDNLSSKLNSVDSSVISDKLATAKAQLSGVTGQLNIPDTSSIGSFASKFGSTSGLTNSPLNELVNKVNATDPAIRARLGLPPTIT